MSDQKSDQKPDSKHDDTFRVVDRRLFTAEGELRPEAQEEKRREQSDVPQTPRSAKPEKPAALPTEPLKSSGPATEAQPEPASDKNFHNLVDFLARNAAALMGGIPDPGTGQAYMDLEGAQEMIDMLDTLRDKTRGHLSAEEEALLGDVIGSLKLSYMQISKAAARAMREGAKGGR